MKYMFIWQDMERCFVVSQIFCLQGLPNHTFSNGEEHSTETEVQKKKETEEL